MVLLVKKMRILGLLAILACGSPPLGTQDDDSAGPEDIAGTYTLQTVDGVGLPVVVHFRTEVTAGSMTLDKDMTCSVSMTSADGISTHTTTVECTYTFKNGAITTTTDEFPNGSITGSTLTFVSNGWGVFIFRK